MTFTVAHVEAYKFIQVRQEDEWNFTPLGHYEFLVMLMGFMNTPTFLQIFITEVLCEALNCHLFVCMDNILICNHVRWAFQLLLENQLIVKLKKSLFHALLLSFIKFSGIQFQSVYGHGSFSRCQWYRWLLTRVRTA